MTTLVIGVNDANIHWSLLAEQNLTLKKAAVLAQALETVDCDTADL